MRILFPIFLSVLFVTFSFAQEAKQKLEKGLYAKIETSKGEVFLKLYAEEAPLTVANFVGLAEGKLKVFDTIQFKEPYYNGVKFHRVIANFMIQGGDPTGTGSGGPGYKFWDETSSSDRFDRKGLLAMANAGPNTNGSQFFITHVPTPHLNGKHTIFGEVLEGQDVVDAIQQGDEIQKIKIIKKGLKYKWFYNASKVFKKEYAKVAAETEKERLESQKLIAKNNVRLAEAKARNQMSYMNYFYDLVKEIEPSAVQTESGLVYVIKEQGEGESPVKGNKVSLHYLGKFLYGGKFDSSYDRNQPLDFEYLVMGLIPGFNEGVGLSNKGMKIDLYIPYYLGYGKNGRGGQIPPYSDLIFQLEILDIQAND